jgi:hypothetical protein
MTPHPLRPFLIEIVNTEVLPASRQETVKVGQQYVVGKYYADMAVADGTARILREMPEETPYGEYKCPTA